jgi:hypothetical protein
MTTSAQRRYAIKELMQAGLSKAEAESRVAKAVALLNTPTESTVAEAAALLMRSESTAEIVAESMALIAWLRDLEARGLITFRTMPDGLVKLFSRFAPGEHEEVDRVWDAFAHAKQEGAQ